MDGVAICRRAAETMPVFALHHEDLRARPNETLAALQRFLLPEGAPILPYPALEGEGRTHKIVASIKDQMKNWDEVEAAFRGTPMHHCLEESTEVGA